MRRETLPVLSLWQPHATLVVAPDPKWNNEAAKVCETRSWQPFLPLPFTAAVHATKTWNGAIRATVEREPFASTLKRLGFWAGHPRQVERCDPEVFSTIGGMTMRTLPLGAIVGTVEVVDCMTATDWLESRHGLHIWEEAERYDQEKAFGFYAPGRYAWLLRNPRMLENAIPFTGRQQALYALDDATQDKIDLQLGRTAA